LPSLRLSRGRIGGYVNTELTPEIAAELGAVLGTMLGERSIIVTARDYYPPSRMIKRAFTAGLMSTGATVIDFHATTTPELVFAIKRFGAKAGVQFTVSNVEENYINFKIFDFQGIEYSADRLDNMRERLRREKIIRTRPERIGWVTYAEYIHDIYVASLINYIDADPIINTNLKILADLNYGPANIVLSDILSQLGVDLITLNAHKPPLYKGVFNIPHPGSINVLSKAVKAMGANLGVAFSADASHIFVVDEQGIPLEPEELFVLLARFNASEAVITTTSTSQLIEKSLEPLGFKIYRVEYTPDSVSRSLRRKRVAFGGTDCGEYIFSGFTYSPDGILSLLKILELISKIDKQLSELRKEIRKPRRYSLPIEIEKMNAYNALYKLVRNRELDDAIVTPLYTKIKVLNRWFTLRVESENKLILESEKIASKSKLESIAEQIKLLL